MNDTGELPSARPRDADGGPTRSFPVPPIVGPIELGGSLSLSLELGLRLPRFCDLAFDATLVGEGWYGCERAGDVAFRWMGVDESASIALAVDRSIDLVATLAIYHIRAHHFSEALRIALDEPANLVPHQREDNSASFVLPRDDNHGGLTRIFILVGQGLATLQDPRSLSIACCGLRVRPQHAAQEDGGRRRVTVVSSLSHYLERLGEAAPLQRSPDRPASVAKHDRT